MDNKCRVPRLRDPAPAFPGRGANLFDHVIIINSFCSFPKGVVLAHRNLVATMKCLMFMVMPRDDIYIAFLPLAHVLELLAENTMMLFGIKV